MFTTNNTANTSVLASAAAAAAASSANTVSTSSNCTNTARSTSRGSPYSHTYSSYSNPCLNSMHPQNTSGTPTGYQDYSSMYHTMDPTVAWHAAYSANLYRGYEAAAAAHDSMWPPQGYSWQNYYAYFKEISDWYLTICQNSSKFFSGYLKQLWYVTVTLNLGICKDTWRFYCLGDFFRV